MLEQIASLSYEMNVSSVPPPLQKASSDLWWVSGR